MPGLLLESIGSRACQSGQAESELEGMTQLIIEENETSIKAKITKYLKDQGEIVLRLNSGGAKVKNGWLHGCPTGTPDIVWLSSFGAVFIEVKKPGEEPSKKQLEMHDQLRTRGYLVVVASSLESFQAWLKGLMSLRA